MAVFATSPQVAEDQTPSPSQASSKPRYLALDAYRGFVMMLLVSNGFGFGHLQGHPQYGRIAAWFEHVPWEGAVFWDLVYPLFLFIFGVAMPFSLARREEEGADFRQNLKHVVIRALKLFVLSHILVAIDEHRLYFQFYNVLTQFALAYPLCFLIMQLRFRWQALTGALLLAGYWALYVLFPGPEGPFSKTGNIGAVIDVAVLGYNYPGYYVSSNFIGSTVTALFGVWTGMLIRSSRPISEKLKVLALGGLGGILAGLVLSPVNPMIKRLWTASYTLYTGGWAVLLMILFIGLIEVGGFRKPAFPLMVLGMNSIFAYSCMYMLARPIYAWLEPFTGGFKFLGDLRPVGASCAVFLVIWSLCYWLYQHKIFLKL